MAFCQIHYWKPLGSRGSYALLSRHNHTRTAVVFVHGFLGHAIDTWASFQTQIDQVNEGLSWWATSDLYFFQYPSTEDSISMTASSLLAFLQDYLPTPGISLCQQDARLGGDFAASLPEPVALRTISDYQELVLVGHSQGAVVLRQAILFALEVSTSRPGETVHSPFHEFLLNARLCLFSPAHMGAQISGIAGLVTEIPLVRRPFEAILRNFFAKLWPIAKGF